MGNGYRKCWTPSNKEAVIDLDFTMTTSNLHLDVDVWLKHLELDSYYSLFKNYAGVEEMLLLSERDLKDLGIKNGSHRAIIATSLVILRDKYEKGHQNKSGLKNSIRKSRSCDSSPRESWTSRGRQNRASWNSMKESNQTGNHPLSSPIRTSSGAEVFDEDNQKACNIASLHRKSSFPCSHVIGHNTSATDSNTSTLQKKSSGRTTGQDQKSFSNNALSLLNNSDDVGHQQDQCSTGLPPLPVKTSAILEKVEANSKIPLDNVPSLARRSLVSKHCQQQQLNYINSSLQRESLINVNKKTTEDEQQAIYINSIGPSSDAMKTKDDKTSVKVQTSDQINKNDQVKNGTDTKVNGFEIYTKSGSENASIVLELSSENYNNQKIPLRASQQSGRSPLATTLTKENKSIVCSSCPGILSKIGDDGIGAVNPYKDTKTYHNTIIDNLHSYPWYHGAISRQKAEQLVVKNGDFLIRDCNSRAGSYVLTTWWNGQPLHFVIDKVENLHKLSYRFADGNYDSIYELVRNLMETRKRLSLASDAVLTHPVTRSSCQGSRGNLDYFSKNHGSSNEVPCLPPKKTPLCKHETPSTDLRIWLTSIMTKDRPPQQLPNTPRVYTAFRTVKMLK
ncbi:uncharacterized protein LOC143230339 isoform X2 [Tachypleus tridentatus]|uniref:uncharacterized protein LOC143230339 isoform X2 n=1 Tax=Tachypleus tridentatus TaxID=6853 RepID=UPI003FD0093C